VQHRVIFSAAFPSNLKPQVDELLRNENAYFQITGCLGDFLDLEHLAALQFTSRAVSSDLHGCEQVVFFLFQALLSLGLGSRPPSRARLFSFHVRISACNFLPGHSPPITKGFQLCSFLPFFLLSCLLSSFLSSSLPLFFPSCILSFVSSFFPSFVHSSSSFLPPFLLSSCLFSFFSSFLPSLLGSPFDLCSLTGFWTKAISNVIFLKQSLDVVPTLASALGSLNGGHGPSSPLLATIARNLRRVEVQQMRDFIERFVESGAHKRAGAVAMRTERYFAVKAGEAHTDTL
jgi:hypothetical protein